LVDELIGNLDEQTAARVMDQLLHVVKSHDTALVLVTHHAGFAARTGRRYRLVEGVLEPVTA
jgi:predicted ABC-type transport system involved in lysophospholipase L1 biosynthesis ATPase subunit